MMVGCQIQKGPSRLCPPPQGQLLVKQEIVKDNIDKPLTRLTKKNSPRGTAIPSTALSRCQLNTNISTTHISNYIKYIYIFLIL